VEDGLARSLLVVRRVIENKEENHVDDQLVTPSEAWKWMTAASSPLC
jgi:hypothetical protein